MFGRNYKNKNYPSASWPSVLMIEMLANAIVNGHFRYYHTIDDHQVACHMRANIMNCGIPWHILGTPDSQTFVENFIRTEIVSIRHSISQLIIMMHNDPNYASLAAIMPGGFLFLDDEILLKCLHDCSEFRVIWNSEDMKIWLDSVKHT